MKKILKITLIVLVSIYLLFLALPLIITPVLNKYIPLVNEEIKKTTGFLTSIEGFRIVTTPKLTVGVSLKEFVVLTPDKKEILKAGDFSAKMSLLPLIAKKIEVDLVSLKNLEIKLGINKNGTFELEEYIPTVDDVEQKEALESPKSAPMELPFGIRLSNKLPDIKLGNYNLEFIDLSTGKRYEIEGEKTEIRDFVLNKGLKVFADGRIKLAEREQFRYHIKVNNKIMPDLDLHELVFNPQPVEQNKKTSVDSDFKINILNIFKGIYNNKITANLDVDLVLTSNGNSGYIKADNISIVELPPSNINLEFKNNKIDIDSQIYTANQELSSILGHIKTGKKTDLDLKIKSNIELNNIFKILNAIAMTFDIKDLQTLSAKGKLDADFNITSNLKTINSNGYLRIPNANINYALYKICIDAINADVVLNNNNIDIKNLGFSILNQPLKFYGKITQDAKADLHLIAEKLSLKGLMVACGQAVLLKENPINSGTVSIKADIVGPLDKIKPTIKVDLDNIDIKNIPSNTVLKLPYTTVNILSDGLIFSGKAESKNIRVINPAANVNIPNVLANISENVIEITKTPVAVEKINFDVSGKIKNYLTEKITLDFITGGDIKSTLKGDINIFKQIMNLVFATIEDSTIIVPMFDKSSMTFNGNINISGNFMNPMLSGAVNVPLLSIPEIPVVIENLVAKLHGPILKGHATVSKFASGGIVAENCTTDFLMKGVNFYLNNLKGTAFGGKINGNIIYNMSDLNTTIDFHGVDMDAERAVKGAVGISNALSGTLSFDTNLTLKAVDYNDMMRSMKGGLTFKVLNGSFGNICRLENFLGASNIINNGVLKTTVSTLSNLNPIKDTAKYDYINGKLNFSNGWANIDYIKSTGKSLSYYINGKLNLINMSTNLIILGRLDSYVIKYLGPIGEFSVDKILSNIPVFGTLTSSLVNIMTTDPRGEKISEIPALTNEKKNGHKDFKVVFNGGLESKSSVKSFKWLTKVDTTAIEEQKSVVETVKSLKTTVNTDVKNVVNTVKSQQEALKNTAKDLKNLLKF